MFHFFSGLRLVVRVIVFLGQIGPFVRTLQLKGISTAKRLISLATQLLGMVLLFRRPSPDPGLNRSDVAAFAASVLGASYAARIDVDEGRLWRQIMYAILVRYVPPSNGIRGFLLAYMREVPVTKYTEDYQQLEKQYAGATTNGEGAFVKDAMAAHRALEISDYFRFRSELRWEGGELVSYQVLELALQRNVLEYEDGVVFRSGLLAALPVARVPEATVESCGSILPLRKAFEEASKSTAYYLGEAAPVTITLGRTIV